MKDLILTLILKHMFREKREVGLMKMITKANTKNLLVFKERKTYATQIGFNSYHCFETEEILRVINL